MRGKLGIELVLSLQCIAMAQMEIICHLLGTFGILRRLRHHTRLKSDMLHAQPIFTFSATSGLLSAAQWMTPSRCNFSRSDLIINDRQRSQLGLNSANTFSTWSLSRRSSCFKSPLGRECASPRTEVSGCALKAAYTAEPNTPDAPASGEEVQPSSSCNERFHLLTCHNHSHFLQVE